VSALSLREIEHVLRHADPQTRHQTLRGVADLFLSDASLIDEGGVAIFDDVFDALIVDPERTDLVDLSQRMAPVSNAPKRLIKRLAHDADIAIAGPVLRQSPRRSADDLCDIARSKGNAHMLAMSDRSDLTEPVTDVLIAEGDERVASAVARNHSAKLSADGVGQLLEKSAFDRSISATLMSRPDISEGVLHIALAKSACREKNDLSNVAIMQMVHLLDQANDLGEAQIAAFAREGSYEHVVAALAVKTGLKYGIIEKLTYPSRVSGLVLVCKSMSLSWATVESVLVLCKARANLSDSDVVRLRREFLELSRAIAERIVRFWHLRQSAGAA
jgi:uncharacterized protein (DUF2336 family)